MTAPSFGLMSQLFDMEVGNCSRGILFGRLKTVNKYIIVFLINFVKESYDCPNYSKSKQNIILFHVKWDQA